MTLPLLPRIAGRGTGKTAPGWWAYGRRNLWLSGVVGTVSAAGGAARTAAFGRAQASVGDAGPDAERLWGALRRGTVVRTAVVAGELSAGTGAASADGPRRVLRAFPTRYADFFQLTGAGAVRTADVDRAGRRNRGAAGNSASRTAAARRTVSAIAGVMDFTRRVKVNGFRVPGTPPRRCPRGWIG